jgi:hypothetical protein
VFAHTDGVFGKAIRFAEHLRWKRASYWNHVAIVSHIVDGQIFVIQAEPRGVSIANIDTLGEVMTVSPPEGVDINKVLVFLDSNLGEGYGILSIISCAFDIISPNWFPELRRDYTYICSALVGEALRYGGWLRNWGSIYTVTPSQLWLALNT